MNLENGRRLKIQSADWEISQACDMCRKKKIKCDGKMPSCTHCINYKTECVFTQVEKKRAPPKGYATQVCQAAIAIAYKFKVQSTLRVLRTV